LEGRMSDARGKRRNGIGKGLNRILAGLVLIVKGNREPSLDTPNTRPTTVSSQGPKLTHGKTPQLLYSLTSF
jgi:hypothetical protein